MSRTTSFTLLNLSEYARILGLSGLHFNQGVSSILPNPGCPMTFFQHDWQNPDRVSREQIGIVIAEAERDLSDALGYSPAPTYVEGEFHPYPRPSRPELYGLGGNIRGRYKSIQLDRGYAIKGGQRATKLLGTACWIALDADGDGFTELTVFELTVDESLDPCQVKAYFKEYSALDAANSRTDPASTGADYAWEVRPIRTSLVGTTLTVYVSVWELFRPQLQEELGPKFIDADDWGLGPPNDPCDSPLITDLGSYVDQLVFYREYTDPKTQVTFLWGADLACRSVTCADSTQTGCFSVKSPRNSLVSPRPATYNTTDENFVMSSWSEGIEPDGTLFWYLAGWTPRNQRGCNLLDPYWAKTIAMLATARFDWPLCDCANSKEITKYWQQDVSKITTEKSFFVDPEELSNPFGTRVGEILAWRRLRARLRKRGQTVRV